MDIEIHKNNLKKYIEEDISFREPLKNISDFDKYCYNHCLDIKEVLSELDKKDKIINQMVIYIMTHSSVPTLRHRFCPNYEREECKYNCDDTKVKSKCIIEYFTKKVEGK